MGKLEDARLACLAAAELIPDTESVPGSDQLARLSAAEKSLLPLDVARAAACSALARAALGAVRTVRVPPARTSLYNVHVVPTLSVEECTWVIEMAERHAAARPNGWERRRHPSYPTTDLAVHDIPELLSWFKAKQTWFFLPIMRALFLTDENKAAARSDLSVCDAFVAKYSCEAGGQRGLATHMDGNELSFNVQLNERSEFEGGGTRFERLAAAAEAGGVEKGLEDGVLRPQQGEALFHCGKMRHAGHPISHGTRYILAVFVKLQSRRLNAKLLEDAARREQAGGACAARATEEELLDGLLLRA
jgi:hypothetical protein